jgi:hypothetical protein
MKGLYEMDEKEFYRVMLEMNKDIAEINGKVDRLLERTVSKDDCQKSKQVCYKENIEPLKAFMYKLIGALLIINVVLVLVIKKI